MTQEKERTMVSPYAFVGFKYNDHKYRKLTPQNQDEIAKYYLDTISSYYGLDKTQIIKKNRMVTFVVARNVCIYFIRQKTHMAVKRIGNIFMRDHSSVLHSLSVVESQLSSKFPNQYKDDIENIKKLLWIK